MPEKTTAIQVELPQGLLTFIDKLVDNGQYATRTEVVRAAIRAYQEQTKLFSPRSE